MASAVRGPAPPTDAFEMLKPICVAAMGNPSAHSFSILVRALEV